MPELSDETMKQVLQRVNQFLDDLRALGVEQVQLEHGYIYRAGTTTRHYQHNGQVIRAYQHKRMNLVVATARETQAEGK